MPRVRLALSVCAALALACLAGCGSDIGNRTAVSGTVSYKGEPLDQGTIEFIPHPGVKTQSGGMITNGRFSIPAEKGLEPGIYTIKISSMEGGGPTDEPGGLPGKEPKERIPARYNTKSKVTEEVKKARH